MTFPHSRGAADQNVALGPDVVAAGQGEDLLAVDAGVGAEVEALQGLRRVDGRAPDAQGELLLGSPLDLVFKQACQEVEVGPAALDGLPVAGLQRVEHAGEAQVLELRGQLVLGRHPRHGSHATPPKRWPSKSAAVRTNARAGGPEAGTGAGASSNPCTKMRLIVASLWSSKQRARAQATSSRSSP